MTYKGNKYATKNHQSNYGRETMEIISERFLFRYYLVSIYGSDKPSDRKVRIKSITSINDWVEFCNRAKYKTYMSDVYNGLSQFT